MEPKIKKISCWASLRICIHSQTQIFILSHTSDDFRIETEKNIHISIISPFDIVLLKDLFTLICTSSIIELPIFWSSLSLNLRLSTSSTQVKGSKTHSSKVWLDRDLICKPIWQSTKLESWNPDLEDFCKESPFGKDPLSASMWFFWFMSLFRWPRRLKDQRCSRIRWNDLRWSRHHDRPWWPSNSKGCP